MMNWKIVRTTRCTRDPHSKTIEGCVSANAFEACLLRASENQNAKNNNELALIHFALADIMSGLRSACN
jgi:hypothetical protein